MTDKDAASRSLSPGLRTRIGGTRGIDPAIAVGLAVSAVWIVLALVFWLVLGGAGAITGLAVLVAVALPVVLIWLAATVAREARTLRADSARLNAVLDQLDQKRIAEAQKGAIPRPMTSPGRTAVDDKLDRLIAAQTALERRLAATDAARAAEPETSEGPQASFDLAPEVETPEPLLDADDFIRAVNFPETADDSEGFDALRRALGDPRSARLLQAAQDVLTLLSQDGLYMDDMTPDRARPDVWRRFAAGERGRAIAPLGGIHDKAAVARLAHRMRDDQIFRDTIHHFLRSFDRTFAAFAEDATDAQIVRFSDTRTARAFMLLSRVAGMFD